MCFTLGFCCFFCWVSAKCRLGGFLFFVNHISYFASDMRRDTLPANITMETVMRFGVTPIKRRPSTIQFVILSIGALLWEPLTHQPGWLMCESLILDHTEGEVRSGKKRTRLNEAQEGVWASASFPLRVVHYFCSAAALVAACEKILSGHNYSAVVVKKKKKPLSAFMCCQLIVGNIMFPLLFTLFIGHSSSSLLNRLSPG